MEHKNSSDISANDLLAQLKANMEAAEAPAAEAGSDGRKKYRFRRSGRPPLSPTEEQIRAEMPDDDDSGFVSPVPRSDIEELDLDALMKKYLPEEDYERMTAKDTILPEEDEFVRSLSSFEEEELPVIDDDDMLFAVREEEVLAAPDTELYDHLSEGGKVCDVPELENRDEMSDTRQAPLRPMSEADRTIAYGLSSDDEEGGFVSVRELFAAETMPIVTPAQAEIEEEEETIPEAPTSEVTFVDAAPTSEVSLLDQIEMLSREAAAEDAMVTASDEPAVEETVAELFDIAATSDESEGDNVITDEPEPDTAVADEPLTEQTTVVPTVTERTIVVPTVDELSDEGMTTDETVAVDPITEGADDEEPSEGLLTAEPLTEEMPETAAKTAMFDQVYGEAAALVPEQEEETAEDFRPDDDFDETDANLMLAFGMEEELEAAIGKKSADELRESMDHLIPEEDAKEKVKSERESKPAKEYVSPAETKEILEAYKNEYGKSALRMFALVAVALILFFYENIGIFGGKLADALNPAFYPIVHLMVGLQILFVGFAVIYRQVIRGFRALLDRRPTSESYLPLLLAASVIYTVVSCFFPAGAPVISFHFPVALCLLFELLGQRLDLRREIMTFRIISSRRGKFALEKLDIDDAELETKAFDRFLPKQPDIFRINKTAFIDGYFARTAKYSSLKQALNAFLPAALVAMAAGLIVGLVALKRWNEAVMLSYAAFAFSLPATVFFTYSLPAFKAAKIAYADGSAIVGESALDEYTSAASISFDDREVFPTSGVKLRSIKVFGSGRLDTVIYDMASVYAMIGGPLADVLKVATADLGRSDETEILSLDTDGVEATVDGQHIYLGKADYLRHNGYLPVSDPDDEEIEAGDTSILFLVRNDEVVAKVYVRYGIDPEFERTLKSLYRSGICVGIKTIDPNINDDMLSTRIRLSKYPVRVLKYTDVSDRSRGSERTDSGIVSKKSVKSLLRAFTLCDKVKHITKTNLLINALTVVIGVLLAVAAALLGSVSAISSVYVALFQLFWLIPVYLISKFLLL